VSEPRTPARYPTSRVVSRQVAKQRRPGPRRVPARGTRLHRSCRSNEPLTDLSAGLRVRGPGRHVEVRAGIARQDVRAMPKLARYPHQTLFWVHSQPTTLVVLVVPILARFKLVAKADVESVVEHIPEMSWIMDFCSPPFSGGGYPPDRFTRHPALPRHALPCLGLLLSIPNGSQDKTVLAHCWSFMGLVSRCAVIPRHFRPFPCPSSAHRDYQYFLRRPEFTFGAPRNLYHVHTSSGVARSLQSGELMTDNGLARQR
jgi:hypothetical protein